MPPFTRSINHLRHPALSLFGISLFNPTPARAFASTSPSGPTCTRYLIRQPSPAAPRECPTPLVFVRATGLQLSEDEEWTDWTGMFAEKGYTALEIDIAAPPTSAESPFPSMTSRLANQSRLLAIPFPPIIVSSGTTCLLTQSYVSDNPASGLVLVNPPPDSDMRQRGDKVWEWPQFNYEPRFPILVVAEEEGMDRMRQGSRLMRAAKGEVGRGGKGISVETIRDGERGEETRVVCSRGCHACGTVADGR